MRLTGTARLELNRTNRLSLLPQVSASWKRGKVTYRSSIGRAIRFGDFTERYVSFNLPDLTPLRNIGNPDLKPETSVTMDLGRSEEHTSELQSRGHLVCRLLLEKKK